MTWHTVRDDRFQRVWRNQDGDRIELRKYPSGASCTVVCMYHEYGELAIDRKAYSSIEAARKEVEEAKEWADKKSRIRQQIDRMTAGEEAMEAYPDECANCGAKADSFWVPDNYHERDDQDPGVCTECGHHFGRGGWV